MKITQASPPQGTVRDWLDHRATQGGIAFTFPETGDTLDWPTLRERAGQIARGLLAQGAAKGDSVAIVMPNGRAAIEALYGTLAGGFCATMINLAAGRDAIAYALDHSGARLALVDDSVLPLFSDAANGLPVTRLSPDDLTNDSDTPLPALTPADRALLMYTSGTTGRPKGVVHTQSSLLAGGWTTAIAHALSAQDRGLCVLPIYHINGLCVSVMGALVSGGSLALCSRFSSSSFWDQADRGKVTWFSVVPTIISHLLHSDMDPTPRLRARLRFGRSASSPLAPEVQTAFETRFAVPIIETMGLTETAAQILSNPLPPGPRKIGSPGIAFGNEVAILGPDLGPLPHGHEGEIAVRGPNVMLEYLRNPQATRDTFTPDGWLRTGDLGRQDADGYFFVTGRLKELIIKGGENIAPREVDEALYAHPEVIEAAAFARPCPRYGERIEAAVTIRPGSTLTEADLLRICVARLGPFKSPDRVHFLPDLPKGPSGKIQRRRLTELIKE